MLKLAAIAVFAGFGATISRAPQPAPVSTVAVSPAPSDAVASRTSKAVFGDEDLRFPVTELEPENCVNCAWHQRCDPGFHTADAGGGGYTGAHYDCLANQDPYWCSGHPICSSGGALHNQTIMDLALRVADGDGEALATLRAEFPDNVRENTTLNTIEVLGCPKGFAYVTAALERFMGAATGE